MTVGTMSSDEIELDQTASDRTSLLAPVQVKLLHPSADFSDAESLLVEMGVFAALKYFSFSF